MEWIDVNDKLPELDEDGVSDDVLGFIVGEGEIDVVYLNVDIWNSSKAFDFDLPITYWMPLPNPPNG